MINETFFTEIKNIQISRQSKMILLSIEIWYPLLQQLEELVQQEYLVIILGYFFLFFHKTSIVGTHQ